MSRIHPLSYEEGDTNAGEDLYIFHYDVNRNTWEALPFVRRNLERKTITALATTGFSPFGLFNAKTVAGGVADINKLNAEILPRLVQAMVASTAASVESRMDAIFSGRSRTASYRLDGQTVQLDDQTRLSTNLQQTLQSKLPGYMMSLKDDTMDWKQMMSNSSFVLPLNVADDGSVGDSELTVWGSGDYTKLSGKNWEGDVFGVQLGADKRVRDDLLVGGLVSWSKGDVDYQAINNEKGEYKHEITSIHPYMAWSGDGIKLWGSAGFGQGKLEIDQTKQGSVNDKSSSDTSLLSLVAGVKGQLSQSGLSLKSDLMLVQISIAGSDDFDPSGNRNIPAQNLSSQRLRLILEFERESTLASGGVFKPTMELGVRYDGGDGDKGAGAILGAGLHYANAATGLSVEGKLHALVGQKDYKEWGVQGTISLAPGVSEHGLSFSMSPSYGSRASPTGGDTGSNADQVWQGVPEGNSEHDYQMQVKTRLAYGIVVSDGSGLLTPHGEITVGGESKNYSLGINWKRNSRHTLYGEVTTVGGESRNYQLGIDWNPYAPFSMHLVGERKEYASGINKHSVLLESRIRF